MTHIRGTGFAMQIHLWVCWSQSYGSNTIARPLDTGIPLLSDLPHKPQCRIHHPPIFGTMSTNSVSDRLAGHVSCTRSPFKVLKNRANQTTLTWWQQISQLVNTNQELQFYSLETWATLFSIRLKSDYLFTCYTM